MPKFYLLGYKSLYSVESQLTFQWNIHPPSSGNEAGFLLGLFFDPEDGGHMFLWNIS
jgi:hypothetical protein